MQDSDDTINQLEDKGEEGSEEEIVEEVATNDDKGAPEISLAALASTPTMRTMKMMGTIMGV